MNIKDVSGIGVAVGSVTSLALIWSIFAPEGKTWEVVDAVFGLDNPTEVSVSDEFGTSVCVPSSVETNDLTVQVDGQTFVCPGFGN